MYAIRYQLRVEVDDQPRGRTRVIDRIDPATAAEVTPLIVLALISSS